ncbi:MAG: hypothetical protein HYW88_02260 [Candidatus Sungbacteria bacterium]|nr:hypothetical protein [Candidatus Sungbacteria bacterium]
MEEKILKHEEESKLFEEQDEERAVAKDFRSEIDRIVKEGTLPPVSIDIFFSSHGTPEDIKGFEDRLKDADVYIPEALLWNEEALAGFRDVSAGKKEPQELLKELGVKNTKTRNYAVTLHRLKVLYNSGKPVGFIDLPANTRLAEEYFKNITFNLAKSETFNDSIRAFCDYEKDRARLETMREEHMLNSLGKVLQEIVRAHPKLAKKEKLNVLLTLGSAHTGVFHGLAMSDKNEATRSFSTMPYQWGYETEILRRYRFGKPVDRILASRGLFEKILMAHLPELFWLDSEKSDTQVMISRHIISVFSAEDIQHVIESKTEEEFLGIFFTAIEEKGLKPYVKEIMQKHFAKEDKNNATLKE